MYSQAGLQTIHVSTGGLNVSVSVNISLHIEASCLRI